MLLVYVRSYCTFNYERTPGKNHPDSKTLILNRTELLLEDLVKETAMSDPIFVTLGDENWIYTVN